jgi:hypothetical protein
VAAAGGDIVNVAVRCAVLGAGKVSVIPCHG